MISITRNRALAANSRLILMAGFGGLLLLMAFAEFDGMQALTQIQRSNDEIREDFLRRTRVLDRIRADLYVSGTYVRDYLLEPESGKAEGHRYSLLESRSDMDAALGEYRKLVNGAEAGPFQVLTQDLGVLLERARSGLRMERGRNAGATATFSCATRFSRAARRCWGWPTRFARSTKPN